MSHIITVWGNPGSGKSLFCCNLAKFLTSDKTKALIICGDSQTPIFPVWLPSENILPEQSIGQVLSSLDINTATIAQRIVILKNYPFIGLMGYTQSETPLAYPDLKYGNIKTLISEASKLVDYIIIDCSSNMINFFTPTAIESADVIVSILTPDLRGLHYYKAHVPLLSDAKFNLGEHIKLAGMARPFHTIDEMDSMIGGFHGLLPYTKELERDGTTGDMFTALKHCNNRYMKAIHAVSDKINQSKKEAKPIESTKRHIL